MAKYFIFCVALNLWNTSFETSGISVWAKTNYYHDSHLNKNSGILWIFNCMNSCHNNDHSDSEMESVIHLATNVFLEHLHTVELGQVPLTKSLSRFLCAEHRLQYVVIGTGRKGTQSEVPFQWITHKSNGSSVLAKICE